MTTKKGDELNEFNSTSRALTNEGYIDLSKIPIEDLPIPLTRPERTDKTIRFTVCDAPSSLSSYQRFGNAPFLLRDFSEAENGSNVEPRTREEMFSAVYTHMLRDKMISEEGNSNTVYLDSVGKPTVGIGHLITGEKDLLLQGKKLEVGQEISEFCKNRLFEHDVTWAINAAIDQAQDIGRFQRDFVTGLISVNFQLGENWPDKWPKAYQNMKDGDFANAMVEIISGKGGRELSKWSQQTPYRTIEFLKVLAQEVNEDKINMAENTASSNHSDIEAPPHKP